MLLEGEVKVSVSAGIRCVDHGAIRDIIEVDDARGGQGDWVRADQQQRNNKETDWIAREDCFEFHNEWLL